MVWDAAMPRAKRIARAIAARLRDQLLDRRHRLEDTIAEVGPASDLMRLLKEVDSALERMEARVFGICEVCKETVAEDALYANPLIQYCLCLLTPEQQQ